MYYRRKGARLWTRVTRHVFETSWHVEDLRNKGTLEVKEPAPRTRAQVAQARNFRVLGTMARTLGNFHEILYSPFVTDKQKKTIIAAMDAIIEIQSSIRLAAGSPAAKIRNRN